MPLLADEGGAVAKQYGAHTPIVGTKRAVIVIDEDGIVRYRHDHRLASTTSPWTISAKR